MGELKDIALVLKTVFVENFWSSLIFIIALLIMEYLEFLRGNEED